MDNHVHAAHDITMQDSIQSGAMTVAQLKNELRRLRLRTSGNKAELIERLEAAICLEGQKEESDDEYDDKEDGGSRRLDALHDTDDDEDDEDDDRHHRRSRCFLSFRDMEDSIGTFSGDDGKNINQWISDFRETAKLCAWTNVQKTIYAKKLLRGSARLFINYEVREKTWRNIKAALKTEFSPKTNSHAVHKELQRRTKRKDETYHEYCYRMLEIASKVNMEIPAVIQYIIDGVADDEVNKMILYGAASIAELKRKFDVYETLKNKMRPISKQEGRNKSVRTNRDGNKVSEQDAVKRCFNCGDRSHLSAACPARDKGAKCFACNEHGHIAARCPKRASNSTGSCNALQVNAKGCQKKIKVNEVEAVALIDTGSDISLMRADFYVKIGAPVLIDRSVKFRGIGSDENVTLGKTKVKVPIDGCLFDIAFHVIPDAFLRQELLIGTDFLRNVELRVKGNDVSISKVSSYNVELPEVNKIDIIDREGESDVTHVPDRKIRDQLRKVITEYKPKKCKDVGVQLTIVLKDEAPVYQRARRLAISEQGEVDAQMQKWMQEGIIRPSYSDFASPIVLVKKKDGTTRICIDYRRLNEKVVKVRYPLPIIDDQIDRLRGAQVFSTIDLENGFFHVSVAEDSRKYTAFIVPGGHYEFQRMPFGLCTSPAYFQKYINAVFNDLAAKNIVSIYMDDLIVPSVDLKEGLSRLKMVLDVASEHGLAINFKKCQFLRTKVNYLGYIIQDGNVTPSDEKTDAVKHFPLPTNVKSVQSFLGLTGYFRKFVPKYAAIANPLTNLLKDGVKFQLGDAELNAFARLKEALSAKPILRIYCPHADTELHTDASSQGYGAILLQRDSEDRLFHPIYYASGKTTDAEAKFHSYELEILAIIKALKKFRIYLIGIPFTIVTDCQAFAVTMRKANCSARTARWAMALQDFQYKVEHRPGRNMPHADALSRNSLPMSMLIDECDSGILIKLRKNQSNDDDIMKTRRLVESNKEDGYVIKSDLLYKVSDGDVLVVVPKLMQASLIRRTHERGHFAVDKTEKLLRLDYWFPRMKEKIEKVIRNCVDCILAEKKLGKQEGWLHPIDKGGAPFDTYHVDHLGPLPSTKKRYVHIFAVVDAFSKFVWIYPTKSTSTAEVLDRLVKQSAVFGNPRRIISDQGTAFTSREFKDYCRDEYIEHVTIVTGVPRGNGQIERMNRTLIPLLTKLSAPSPAEWHKHVDRAQGYINNVPSRSTGMSPFYLLFGTRMKIKEDPELQELLEKEEAVIFQEKRDSIREEARKAISKIQRENKNGYNKRRKAPSNYKEGQVVAIKRTQGGPGLKLAGKFLGPYRVTRVLRNDRYVVEKIGQGEGPKVTSTANDHMKAWRDDPEELSEEDT